MDVKPGYKKTEVGVIPSTWEVKRLGSVGRLEMGKGLLKDEIATTGDIPAIPYTSLYTDFNEVIDPRSIKWFVKSESAPYVVDSPCVLLASSSNVSANTGKACALHQGFPVAVGREVIAFTTSQSVVFISYLLGTSAYRKKTLDLAKGITIKHVYPTTFVEYTISLPPISEQSAIADALNDVDAMLAAQDALIAKKIAIKQGAMQEMMTGKRRLVGCGLDWKLMIFSQIAKIRNEKIATNDVDPDTLCVEMENIGQRSGRLETRSMAGNALSTKYRFQKGDVLFGRLRPYLRKYWLATEYGLCTTEVWPLVADEELVAPAYLFAIVQTDAFIEAASVAFGTHMPRADWSVIRNFEIELPGFTEQMEIVKILEDMDVEITALQQQRDKTAQLKQGMMQQLLTGRIRLI